MIFDWYKIKDLNDFNGTGLVSENLDIFLEGKGQKQILITKGNSIGVVVDGTFLVPGLNGRNPFVFDNKAAFVDAQDQLWIGFVK